MVLGSTEPVSKLSLYYHTPSICSVLVVADKLSIEASKHWKSGLAQAAKFSYSKKKSKESHLIARFYTYSTMQSYGY
jgi:hypothetical protein